MAYGKPEQVEVKKDWFRTGNHRSVFRAHLKRAAHKRRRMQEKTLLDDAPKKNEYRGWENQKCVRGWPPTLTKGGSDEGSELWQ